MDRSFEANVIRSHATHVFNIPTEYRSLDPMKMLARERANMTEKPVARVPPIKRYVRLWVYNAARLKQTNTTEVPNNAVGMI